MEGSACKERGVRGAGCVEHAAGLEAAACWRAPAACMVVWAAGRNYRKLSVVG